MGESKTDKRNDEVKMPPRIPNSEKDKFNKIADRLKKKLAGRGGYESQPQPEPAPKSDPQKDTSKSIMIPENGLPAYNPFPLGLPLGEFPIGAPVGGVVPVPVE
jgi:hypothetical protein